VWWWLENALRFEDYQTTMAEYLKVFPGLIANGRILAYLTLLLTACSISISSYFMAKEYRFGASVTLFIINMIIFIWSMFSLM